MEKNMKILILGSGNAQVDIIEYCRNAGMEVHSCSYIDGGPGKKLADHFMVVDIKDVEGISQYIEENNINLVYSIGSDVAMGTVAKVSEKQKLPCFISAKTAALCNNKKLMRAHLGKDFIGNVDYLVLSDKEDIKGWHRFPSILKPVDSQGQRGIHLLKSTDDFYHYFERTMSFSRSKEIIVEEYLAGPEISVNIYLVNGEIVFSQITDRMVYSEYPGGLVKEHIIPSQIADIRIEKKIYELVYAVIKKISLKNGPAYFQMKIVDNEPKLIEVTPRLDGCHLWRLIKKYAGIDLLGMTMRHLTCSESNISNYKKSNKKYKLGFLSEEPLKPVNRDKYQIANPLFLHWYYNTGEIVNPINGYFEKIGYYISELD